MSDLEKNRASDPASNTSGQGSPGLDTPAASTFERQGIITRARKRRLTFIALFILLASGLFLSAGLGQYLIGPKDLVYGFLQHFGVNVQTEDPQVYAVLWHIRFPRIVLGLLVGASLAVSGAVMQAIFSNPLAEPGIIGVSSGAAVGASITIVFFPNALAGFSVPLGAFCSGLLAVFLVYFLSRSNGKAEVITLVLTGIAITAVCSAITSITTFIAPTTARDQIVFWQMGSLNAASWTQVTTVGIVAAVGLTWAFIISGKLDILALGEKAAGHVGLNVHMIRLSAITLTALLTAAAVSYAGVISFVGLIVPHVLRLTIGPANKYLLPASMLGGALLITISDTAARNLIPFADLPIGIFTALVGGPTFFILLRRRMRGAS